MHNNSTLSYIAPECDVFDVIAEGVMCESTGNTIKPWEENNDFPLLNF